MTNGWDRALRTKTAQVFHLEEDEMNQRHALIFDTYETGKLTFDEYLKRVVFYQKRSFSLEEIKTFIFEAASAYHETIAYIKELKAKYHLKVGVVSNEGRELAVDRIARFHLEEFVDFFVVSSFVHYRKPDLDIYRLAIDIAQVPPTQVAYLDDRALLIEVAKELGIQGIHHTSLETTQMALEQLLNRS